MSKSITQRQFLQLVAQTSDTPLLVDVAYAKNCHIYDLNGKLIDVVTNSVYAQGTHSVTWDGMNLNNETVSSGVYLYKMITPEITLSKQLTLIR